MATDPVLALLPSPLLGSAVWSPVAAVLTARGHRVSVPPATAAVTGPGDVLEAWLEVLPGDVPLVLVPHSNAGLYAAALAAEREVTACVFVDAGLPSPTATTPTAGPGFRELLAGLVEPDGLLPPWTRWWPEQEVADLFGDETLRAAVEAEQPRLPPSYFDSVVPSPPGWADLPAAYLAFGETYAAERAEAEGRGWPVETLDARHLHMLVDPDGVADAVLALHDRVKPS